MGNYKFRLSDMIPNAWFYKLRDHNNNNKSSSKSQKKRHPPPPSKPQHPPPPPPPLSYSRKSYYFSRQLNSDAGYCISNTKHSSNNHFYFPEPPRKSSKHHKPPRKTKTTTAASSGRGCHCRSTAEYDESPPEFSTSPFDSSPEFRTFENDIIIDVDKESLKYHDSVSELDLPRIVTKHAKFNKKETKQRTSPTRKFPGNSPGGVKLRIHSPKIANRKINQITGGRKSVSSSTTRKSISESFAIMKSSYDPQRDFRESMVEMIVENNIRASKDLEDLLACYLSLNSDEYHHLIIKVFKQIWFDLMENC